MTGKTPFEVYAEEEELMLLDDAIDRLTVREQNIIKMRFHENMELTDIAKLVGISPSSMADVLLGAIDSLKRQVMKKKKPTS